jgi:DNA repair protein RadC
VPGRLKERAPDQRPRERLFRLGVERLSEEELVAIVLGAGTAGASSLDLARELLSEGLWSLARREETELLKVRGLGRARVACLKAAFELGRRAVQAEAFHERLPKLADPAVAYRVLKPFFPADREEIWVVFVDAQLRWRGERRLASGGIDYATLAPAEVLRAVLRTGFARFLVAHNHPSGDPTPSAADREWTERLAAGSSALGIEMLDHLVIGRSGFVSLKRLAAGRIG